MRNAIILIILALVFFAAGWTIYRFVTKRAEEVKVTVNNAPALQQAPTATPKPTPVPTATPTPLSTAVATSTPKATTPKVAGGTAAGAQTKQASGKLPKTGPGELSLAFATGMGVLGMAGMRRAYLKRGLAAAYRNQSKL